MLLIKKGQRAVLPSRYRPANNICAVIYDQMTEIFAGDIYRSLTSTPIQLKEGIDLKDAFENSKADILSYLGNNNYRRELVSILVKHLTLSILSDLVNFVYESLSCAQKGKMTVAYSLLRKPFKDELYLLESILVDSDKFIHDFFFDGRPAKYDPSKKSADQQKILISAAVHTMGHGIFDAELLYDWRYNKQSTVGISSFSEHAIHIVTTNDNYKTSDQNLNFVFSRKEDIERYWRHYYTIVPYLLLYTASVTDAVVFKLIDGKKAEERSTLKFIKRLAGLVLWLESRPIKGKGNSRMWSQLFSDVFAFNCQDCGHNFSFDITDYEVFFYTDALICPKCLSSNSMTDTYEIKQEKEE